MKKSILFLSVAIALIACNNEKGGEAGSVSANDVISHASALENYEKVTGGPAFQFIHEEYNFGEITQGQTVEHIFQFVNAGDQDLVISSAKGSCGCTIPEKPDGPIAPGEVGKIKVTFNSAGKKGYKENTVTIKSNAKQNPIQIKIIGTVLVPDNK